MGVVSLWGKAGSRQPQVWPSEGASAILTEMERLWLQTTVVTVDVMRETDMIRMSKAEAITSTTVKRR